MKSRDCGLLIAVALVALLNSGCGRELESPRALPSIVVVTIDTLRADHLGSYGYFRDTSPNLDALASEGVLFTHLLSTTGTTLPAHVALWTSRHPIETGVHANKNSFRRKDAEGEGVRLFAEILSDLGYTTAAFVSATPVKRGTGLGAGFAIYDQPGRGDPARRADETTDRVLDWLESVPETPFFLWVHYFDPHHPYQAPGEFERAFSTEPELIDFLRDRKVANPRDEEILEVNNLYDGEILFVDSEIGRLIRRLRELDGFEESALVVTADHGEGLGQHDRIGHGEIHAEQLHVPLIARFPSSIGLNGRRVDRLLSGTDIVPTLVDVLDLPVTEAQRGHFGGKSAFSNRDPRQYAFSQRSFGTHRKWGRGMKFSLAGKDWKYVYETRGEDQLFDLRVDPGETGNLIGVESEIARHMKQVIEEKIRDYRRTGEIFDVSEEATDKVLKELRALGYID